MIETAPHIRGTDFRRPTPDWHVDDNNLYGPNSLALPMKLGLPGANRGNAAQAVDAAGDTCGNWCDVGMKQVLAPV